jgi:hypothetical protein
MSMAPVSSYPMTGLSQVEAKLASGANHSGRISPKRTDVNFCHEGSPGIVVGECRAPSPHEGGGQGRHDHVPNGEKTNDIGKRFVVQHGVFTDPRVIRMLFEYS